MDDVAEKPSDSGEIPLLDPSKTPKQIYFELLRTWVQHAQMLQQIQASFPYYLRNNYPQLFQPTAGATGTSGQPIAGNGVVANATGSGQGQAQPNANQRRDAELLDPTRQEEIINRNGGYEYTISPLWKRLVAEAIDGVIIFLLKILITMACVDFFDIDLLGIDFDSMRNMFEEDYTELLAFTSDIILLEVISKCAACIYETFWTFNGQGQIGGATPGKMLMGIRIVHAEAVVILDPPQPGAAGNNQNPIKALLYPAANPGFKRALYRSIAKNALIAIFFPLCSMMSSFRHNRTTYDIMTKTVVVEDNLAPVLRRR